MASCPKPERDTELLIEPEHEALRRRAHPLVLHLFYALRTMPVVDRMLVVRACEERLPRVRESDKHERCRLAVERCRVDLGAVPSRKRFADWYQRQPDKAQLPSDTQVKNVFGSWAAVRHALGEAGPIDVLSRRLTSTGPRVVHMRRRVTTRSLAAQGRAVEAADLLEVLRTWASLHPDEPLSQAAVLAWTKREREKVSPCLPVLPTTYAPFVRVFGSWAEAVEHAGLTHRRAPRAGGRERHGRR